MEAGKQLASANKNNNNNNNSDHNSSLPACSLQAAPDCDSGALAKWVRERSANEKETQRLRAGTRKPGSSLAAHKRQSERQATRTPVRSLLRRSAASS